MDRPESSLIVGDEVSWELPSPTTVQQSAAGSESPPSSPLHLSVPSFRAFGAASRLVTSESRLPRPSSGPGFGNRATMSYENSSLAGPSPPHTPSQHLELPYDLSYPSPATWTSSLPRGILRHRPLAPPNTPEILDLSSPNNSPTKSVRFKDAVDLGVDVGSIRGVEYHAPQYQRDWMTSNDSPIPQPQYNVVRPWLKGVMRTTFGRHNSAPNLSSTAGQRDSFYTADTESAPELPTTPDAPSSSFLLHFQNLTFDSARPPPMSPTETSNSDPLNDTSRITWSQMEMEVEDPDWSFEPVMSGQEALEALCEYGSDEEETDLILSPVSPSYPMLASPFTSPTQSTPDKALSNRPITLQDAPLSPGNSPKLPLKYSSPLPSRYMRADADSQVPLHSSPSTPGHDRDTANKARYNGLVVKM